MFSLPSKRLIRPEYDPINFLEYPTIVGDKNERIKIKSNFVPAHFDDLFCEACIHKVKSPSPLLRLESMSRDPTIDHVF